MLLTSLMSFGQDSYSIGDKVNDFNLKGVDGEMHKLSDYQDKSATVVIFTSNHCPYAVLYEDRIIDIQDNYGAKGIQVLAINPNDPAVEPEDSYENMISRAQDKGFNFPYLFDESQDVYPKFGATRTPHVFLVDNTMTLRYIGAIDDNARNADKVEEQFLADALDAILAGKEIANKETKAVGCSIKTK